MKIRKHSAGSWNICDFPKTDEEKTSKSGRYTACDKNMYPVSLKVMGNWLHEDRPSKGRRGRNPILVTDAGVGRTLARPCIKGAVPECQRNASHRRTKEL